MQLGKTSDATEWAEKQRCVALYCLGTDHPVYKTTLKDIEGVKNILEKERAAIMAIGEARGYE